MINLSTHHMGVALKNPIIVGSNNMVYDLNLLRRMEAAGASAVVFKSLFEEQIQLERMQMDDQMTEYNDRNAEMTRLFPDMEHAGPEFYLMKLSQAVKALSIPVFASLNCINPETWVEYAKRIEETGVAGIELNLYHVPMGINNEPSNILKHQLEIVSSVTAALRIPVSVKLSPFSSNALYVINEMDKAGAKGFVLFNRLFQPDIDIHAEKMVFTNYTSHEEDNRLAIRYAGLLYGNIDASICANSGIHSGDDVVKMILAGADSVQVVSTLYKNKIEVIADMLKGLESWMSAMAYESLDDFKGKLSAKNNKDPFAYRRAQYIDILMKSEEIYKKYPTI